MEPRKHCSPIFRASLLRLGIGVCDAMSSTGSCKVGILKKWDLSPCLSVFANLMSAFSPGTPAWYCLDESMRSMHLLLLLLNPQIWDSSSSTTNSSTWNSSKHSSKVHAVLQWQSTWSFASAWVLYPKLESMQLQQMHSSVRMPGWASV